MINKAITVLIIFMLLFVTYLFYANMTPFFLNQPKEKFLSYNGVSGIALDKRGKLYTFNFKQQNQMLKYLNELQPAKKNDLSEMVKLDKIVIYRFNEPDLCVTPIIDERGKGALYFSIPEWSGESYLVDTSEGKLKELLLDISNF